MTEYTAAIIDDEKPARERIRFFLKDCDDIEIVGEADNGENGLALLEKQKPDIVFLDIQMPGMDGFTLLSSCSYHPAVIFISAWDEYALNAFEVNAIDYLLKPYTRERFERSLIKVRQTIKIPGHWEEKLSSLIDTYNTHKEPVYLEQISVKKGYSYKVYNIDDVDFFRMDEGLLYLYAGGERIVIDTPINQLEAKISPASFMRVHRNAFINLKKVKEIIPWGQNRLVLDFGKSGKVQVSRDRIKILKQRIGLKL